MIHYDSDFHRQCQRERMAEIRAEYQRVQAHGERSARASIARYARSAWSHMRWADARRSPVFRG